MERKFDDQAPTDLVRIMANDPYERDKNPLSVDCCLLEVLSFRKLLAGLSEVEKDIRHSGNWDYAARIRALINSHEQYL